MNALNPLLARQLRQAARATPDGRVDLETLTQLVSRSYDEQERDRRLNERATKLMEDELQAANARAQARMQALLNALIHGSKEGVLVTTPAGAVQMANPAAQALFGQDEAALLGQEIGRLIETRAAGDGPEAAGMLRGAVRAAAGATMPVELTAASIGEGDQRQTLWIVRDISDQLRWQASVEENRKRMEDFAQSSSDWFWQHDQSTDRLEVFGGAEHASIAAVAAALRGPAARLGLTFETGHGEILAQALSAGEPFREVQLRLENGNWLSLGGLPRRDAAGSLEGYRGAVRDITPLKTREAELLRAREAADEANKLKSHFLATMSHELRTPMNAILGFSEVIRDQVFGADLERYAEYAANIHQSGGHLLSLINDILDLSKIEAGSYQLHLAPVRLDALVEECVMMVKPQIEKGRLTLTEALQPDSVEVRGDMRALRQIVVNLLSNAVKFTPCGGEVSLALRQSLGAAHLTVRDTGIGISRAFLAHVFEPFRQQDSGLGRKYEGTGLGLAITKKLVEAHGGAIGIESEEGRGTCVTVTLPVLAAQGGGRKTA
jgi:PAS domain S-box-containing protein